MRPRCSTLRGGFGFSGCGDCTSCPRIEQAEMSNSEPSAIALQGIPCMCGLYKFRFEWRKRFAQGSPRFTLSRSRMRSRTGLASAVENQACGIAKYPRLRVHRSGHVTKASKETQKLANDMMDQAMPADQHRLVPKIAWRRFSRSSPHRDIAGTNRGDRDPITHFAARRHRVSPAAKQFYACLAGFALKMPLKLSRY